MGEVAYPHAHRMLDEAQRLQKQVIAELEASKENPASHGSARARHADNLSWLAAEAEEYIVVPEDWEVRDNGYAQPEAVADDMAAEYRSAEWIRDTILEVADRFPDNNALRELVEDEEAHRPTELTSYLQEEYGEPDVRVTV